MVPFRFVGLGRSLAARPSPQSTLTPLLACEAPMAFRCSSHVAAVHRCNRRIRETAVLHKAYRARTACQRPPESWREARMRRERRP